MDGEGEGAFLFLPSSEGKGGKGRGGEGRAYEGECGGRGLGEGEGAGGDDSLYHLPLLPLPSSPCGTCGRPLHAHCALLLRLRHIQLAGFHLLVDKNKGIQDRQCEGKLN